MASKVAVFQEIFKQVLRVSRWFAVAPIRSSAVLGYSRQFNVYSIIVILFLGQISDIVFVIETIHQAKKGVLLNVPQYLIATVSLSLINWEVYKNSERIPRWIEYFNECDKICRVPKDSISARKCFIVRFVVRITTTALFVMMILASDSSMMCYQYDCADCLIIMGIFSHGIITIILMVLTALYSLLITLIYFALINVNVGLMKLNDFDDNFSTICLGINLDVSDFSYRESLRKEHRQTQIKEVASEIRLHAASYLFISDTIKGLKQTDGLSIFLSLLGIVSRLTSSGYLILYLFYCTEDEDCPKNIYVLFFLITVHFCRMMMLIEPCYRTHVQVNETTKQINRLRYFWSEYDLVLYELDHFKRTIEMNDVTYSPLNVFALERSLATKVVGCAITYFIMIFQFHPK